MHLKIAGYIVALTGLGRLLTRPDWASSGTTVVLVFLGLSAVIVAQWREDSFSAISFRADALETRSELFDTRIAMVEARPLGVAQESLAAAERRIQSLEDQMGSVTQAQDHLRTRKGLGL